MAHCIFGGEKTQEELKQDLQMGLSSISQSIVLLESFGLVCVRRKEGRKNVYGCPLGAQSNGNVLENLLLFHVEPVQHLIDSRVRGVEGKEMKKKMQHLSKSWKEFSTKLKRLV